MSTGEKHYQTAIRMSTDRNQKLLFRQKLYYELGNHYYLEGNFKKAKSTLNKVIKIGVVETNWKIDIYLRKAKELLSTL